MPHLANPPRPELLRYSFYPVVLTTGAGDFGAETPTIGFPFCIESATLITRPDTTVTLLWNLIIDNQPWGTGRNPFEGTPVIRSEADDTTLDPRKTRLRAVAPFTLRPRFCWRQAGFRIRLAVNSTTNPYKVGVQLDVAELVS